MAFTALSKKATIELTNLRGAPLSLRPATIVSLTAGPPTKVSLIDGSVSLVKESPDEISAMIASAGRKALAGAPSYAKLKEAIAWGNLREFIDGDDGKALWIEALKTVSYEKPRGKLSRMLRIYGGILSPFALIKSLAGGSLGGGAPSPLEAEMLAKGYQVVRKRGRAG